MSPSPAPCCSRPWKNLSAVFSISSQKNVQVSSCITNVLLYLHAASPRIFAETSVCPAFPGLIRSLSDIVAYVQMDIFHAVSFLARAQRWSAISFPGWFLPSLSSFYFQKSPLAWQHRQVGCSLLSGSYPLVSDAIRAPRMGLEAIVHLTHDVRLKFSLCWGRGCSSIAHACVLIQWIGNSIKHSWYRTY